jgi:RNase P subunit RPR2
MVEAVGVTYDAAKKTFSFSGNGWFASRHATSNYTSTQNTYCAKCHSPLQAKAEADFKPTSAEPIAYGRVEGVTCAACHPSHTVAVEIGRRLGIYQFGKDKTKAEGYKVVHEGEEDSLCLNCHMTRHNEDNPAMELMYVAGVLCIDCHMAPYGIVPGTEPAEHPVKKLFHDFKVASNLPYSCGVKGSMVHCHPEFGVESTLELMPYLKDQHKPLWVRDSMTKKLTRVVHYRKLWNELEAKHGGGGADH